MSRADWLSALIVIVVWGLNFVVMKWGLATLALAAVRAALCRGIAAVSAVRAPAAQSVLGLLAAYGLVQGVGSSACCSPA
jgi:O-acetylserine/cysteine efflux transporter